MPRPAPGCGAPAGLGHTYSWMGEASDIARTVSSPANDPTLVPGQIADALAHLLAICLIAVEVVSAA